MRRRPSLQDGSAAHMTRGLIPLVAVTMLLVPGREARAGETSLAMGLGYVKARRVDATLWYTAGVRFHVRGGFAVEPEIGYWRKAATTQGITVSIRDVQFGANALFVHRAGRDIELFVGAGGGVHSVNGELTTRTASMSTSRTKPGVEAVGGADLKAGDALSFFVAARYDWVLGLPGEDPRRLDQGKFYGGFRLRF